ncbi:hypothetical protein Q9251_03030 [Alkalihalobacillus macyae]|uniref:hypothetical protein n=1 Tax=Guptibacillus hwajinpoensis TaxID=208199 RepID=UPI00273BE558|nr:hypothetical protein [Alkalihalobacillus macyae]MDP4549849.1 hypothetical protein [Alkalihalobacillus macyae]
MPTETLDAINWALEQTYLDILGQEINITIDDNIELVDKVRRYFNDNNIEYGSFSYDDLLPFIAGDDEV